MTINEAKFYLDKLLPQWIGLLPTKEGNILLEASRVVVDVLEQITWIPVTERMPEPKTAVLLYVKHKFADVYTYQLGMWNDDKDAWEDFATTDLIEFDRNYNVVKWKECEVVENEIHS